MATVIDVSSRLGEYMLKGWILTDRICPKCGRVPMMRSPSAASVATQFCVNCDPAPGSAASSNGAQPSPPASGSQVQAGGLPDTSSVSTISYSTRMSRSSTPPTELSSPPDSPVLAPIMDTAELLRRRQQSDTASAEIGRRMLRGWAMLADECPNPDCYGIPLVRPPKTQATIDPRKECVICGIVYVDENDALGRDRLVPIQPLPSPSDTYRLPPPAAAGTSSTRTPIDQGKGKARATAPPAVDAPLYHPPEAQPESYIRSEPEVPLPRISTASALQISARSLEQSLLALSARLDSLSAGPILDPAPIGQTADTIAKVSQALTQVKQLLWSESQARIA
ncbi:hypothetical protein BV20DRAFT_971922 [Pilatotrama ljubarskyi]|nr:hypothetical protein BV20DRAFT_971922 [Pilatotrama ljubarskyi]